MASLRENKPLLYSLVISASVVFVLASGIVPELSEWLEIAPFSDEVCSVCSVNQALICELLSRTAILLLHLGHLPESRQYGCIAGHFAIKFCKHFLLYPSSLQFRMKVLAVLVADFICAYILDSTLSYFLGTAKLKMP